MNWNVKDIIYVVGFILGYAVTIVISWFKVDKRLLANELETKANREMIKNIELKMSATEVRTENKLDELIKSFNSFESTFKEELTKLKYGKQDK